VTVIISEKGWARVRQGHGLDLSGVAFKDGDRAGSALECRSVDSLVILSSEGRAFTVAIASLPDGRGMGAPLPSFVDLGSGDRPRAHRPAGRRISSPRPRATASSAPTATCSRGRKAGKAFLSVEDGASILPPLRLAGKDHLGAFRATVACWSFRSSR
jgi:topoisomerase-4 subunit A